jgi:hypothetical protein
VTSYTVTGSTTNNTFGGGLLQVQVLDNAALAATPATATSTSAYNCSITTTVTGSMVFGAVSNLTANATFTAESGTTILTDFADTTHTAEYGSFRTTSTTGTPGPTTVGSSTTFNTNYGCCALEILASGGTLTIDGSSPAVVDSATLTSLTTASFTPPAGTLLVAMLVADGAFAGTQVATVSSTPSLMWTERINVNAAEAGLSGYLGVWTATIPGAVVPQPPGWVQRVAVVPFRADVIM